MRIRELTLHNFRGFSGPVTFQFADRFTVVAGINGRGKTALLDAIALLASRFLPLVSPARSGYRRIVPFEVHTGAESTELEMKVLCAGIPLQYKLSYTRESGNLVTSQLTRAVRRKVQNAYGENPERADDAAPLAVYFTTDRAGYRLPKVLPSVIPSGQAAAYAGALQNRTVNFRDFMARFRTAIVLEDEERRDNPNFLGSRAVAAISDALEILLGGFDNLRIWDAPLRLVVDKDGVTFDVSQLSDGERSFLALVCDLGRRLALANPRLENPLHGSGVVLIDEIELHLHPKWQREAVDKLRRVFPNIQFIATTHSPFVIQSLRPGELINLDPEEFGEYADKSIEDIAENVMGVDLPQKSERYKAMMEAAEQYFRLLRQPNHSGPGLETLEQRLNELSAPFSDDPAFMALLKLEREIWKGGGHETD